MSGTVEYVPYPEGRRAWALVCLRKKWLPGELVKMIGLLICHEAVRCKFPWCSKIYVKGGLHVCEPCIYSTVPLECLDPDLVAEARRVAYMELERRRIERSREMDASAGHVAADGDGQERLVVYTEAERRRIEQFGSAYVIPQPGTPVVYDEPDHVNIMRNGWRAELAEQLRQTTHIQKDAVAKAMAVQCKVCNRPITRAYKHVGYCGRACFKKR